MESKTIAVPTQINGERIHLVKRSADQVPQIFDLIDKDRQHLEQWMPWASTTKTANDTEKYIQKALRDWDEAKQFDFTFYLANSKEVIGSGGLHTLNWETKTCEVGYWLGKKYEGHGYVTEAVRLLEKLAIRCGFHRMYLSCDPKNERSKKVAIRSRYHLESRQIEAYNLNGTLRDNLRFVKLLNPEMENAFTENLPLGCYIKEVTAEEFQPLVDKPMREIFDNDTLVFRAWDHFDESEREKIKDLNKNWTYPYRHHFVAFHDGKLIGWTWGYQDSRESFYMVNSAIVPEFQGRGVYKALLDISLERLIEKGFQRIWSRHNSTNNNIIAYKLRRGFKITAFETSDVFGQLVHLTYFTSALRGEVLEVRSGQKRPSEQVKKVLQL